MSTEQLRARIDSALRSGESLDDIDESLIEPSGLDQHQKAALWLYAFARQRRSRRLRFVRDHLQLVGLG
jgi:hypothetical protein